MHDRFFQLYTVPKSLGQSLVMPVDQYIIKGFHVMVLHLGDLMIRWPLCFCYWGELNSSLIQESLKKQLITNDRFSWKLPPICKAEENQDSYSSKILKYVGGADLSFSKTDPSIACVALVVLDFSTLEVVHEVSDIVELHVPYVPGFLAFREAPALLELLEKLKNTALSLYPQVLMVDGNGLLHPRDLLTKDYNYDKKFSLAMPSSTGMGFTATGVKKGQIFLGDISTQYRSGKSIVDVKVDTYSNVSTKVTYDVVHGTKATISFNVPDHKSGKLDVHYLHHHAAINSSIGLNPSPLLEVAATIGSKDIAIGGEIGFDTFLTAF